MGKATQLRNLLQRKGLDFILEAHDGLSARIVEEAGFSGIWGSGLTLSASMGVRDNNEASWTQVLERVEFMSDATSIPILLDGDTGHGNFNNVRRFVRKLCERNIAGVAIEDKLFPKTNSFIKGEQQPLADPEEFAGRIKAAKDSQTDPDFCVVARVEALIAGWSMEEALRRAHIYADAGADAILMHSKKSTPDQVLEFTKRFESRLPVVIVPTMYFATPSSTFEQAGISLVIWANHLLRSAITAMQNTAATIHRDKSLFNVEGEVASVKRIFELQGAAELDQAEARYLPEVGTRTRAIILAASEDPEFGDLIKDRPKCMIEINGRSLLERQLSIVRGCGIRDITVVRGYRKERIAFDGVSNVDNDQFATTGAGDSLLLATKGAESGPLLVAFGDIVYRKHVLQSLLDDDGDFTVVVDLESKSPKAKPRGDYVTLSRVPGHRGMPDDEPIFLKRAALNQDGDGELIGLFRLSRQGAAWLAEAQKRILAAGAPRRLSITDLIQSILDAGHPVRVQPIWGNWVDVNDLKDLAAASRY